MSTDTASPSLESARIGSFLVQRVIAESVFDVVGVDDGPFPGTPAIARSIPVPDTVDGRADVEVRLAKLRHLHHDAFNPILESGCTRSTAYWIEAMPVGDAFSTLLDPEQWPISRVQSLIARLGSALQIAHELGLSHGAITPASLYLHPDGSPFLAGLGITAHEVADDQRGLAHVAIQLLSGHSWTDPIVASDSSSGVWPDGRAERLREALTNCTLRVVNVLAQATDPDPRQRFASVRAFATALDGAVKQSAEDLVHSAFEAISAKNHELACLLADKAVSYDPECEGLAVLNIQLHGGSPFGQTTQSSAPESSPDTWPRTTGGTAEDLPVSLPTPGHSAVVQTLLPPELTHGLPQEFLDSIAPQFAIKPVKKSMNPIFVLLMGAAGVLLLLVVAGLATFLFTGQ